METKYLHVESDNDSEMKQALSDAADLLREGHVIAFPTETVYGLGANALDEKACEEIFRIKGRPADNPLIVHIAKIEDAAPIVKYWPEKAETCAKAFWPGPLTLVLPKTDIVPDIVSGGLDTVAVRMPAHTLALELIETAGFPLAAPSANLSGKPSPTEGKHVWQDLQGKIPLIIDAGKCSVGLESTVLDLTGEKPVVLRPGGVTVEQLREILGEVDMDYGIKDDAENTFQPRSPGMKYRHYAPQGELIILTGNMNDKVEDIKRRLTAKQPWERLALLSLKETAMALSPTDSAQFDLVFILGTREKPGEVAGRLFEALRLCDEQQMTTILAEEMPVNGIGLAFMNRLNKAAGKKKFSAPGKI